MRLREILALPLHANSQETAGEFVRDWINSSVRDGGSTGAVFMPFSPLLCFRIPDHEIEIDDLKDLVAVEDIQFVYISSEGFDKAPPQNVDELIAIFKDTSRRVLHGKS